MAVNGSKKCGILYVVKYNLNRYMMCSGFYFNTEIKKGVGVLAKRPLRPDKSGTHRIVYESNRKKLLKTETVCGICHRPVDKSLKYPDPMSPVIDHIIPVAKGGHPSSIDNLQLAHWCCNRQKSDKLFVEKQRKDNTIATNRNLAWSCDWLSYRAK